MLALKSEVEWCARLVTIQVPPSYKDDALPMSYGRYVIPLLTGNVAETLKFFLKNFLRLAIANEAGTYKSSLTSMMCRHKLYYNKNNQIHWIIELFENWIIG